MRLAGRIPWLLMLLLRLAVPAAQAEEITGGARVLPTHEQVLSIPGDPARPVMLQVTLILPDGDGPFPLAVMNHGSSGKPRDNPRYGPTLAARYFLSRGYAVAQPMMRGFAGSGGAQEARGCNQVYVGLRNALDIRAVIDALQQRDFIQRDKVVVAGQSFGGWNTLAYGSLRDPRVKALVNFNGALNLSSCAGALGALATGAREYGRASKVASLWFYGRNDSLVPEATWRMMYAAYRDAGGAAQLVDIGNFMSDSHQMLSFPESLPIWAPRVDALLAAAGLPHEAVLPGYLPPEMPPASGYAALDDAGAIPVPGNRAAAEYAKFLTAPMPRAFFISPRGYSLEYGGIDPVGAGMANCDAKLRNCRLYAVDDRVVWPKPAVAPTPSGFAPLADLRAVPFLGSAGRVGYARFLILPFPRAFAIAPDGGWSAAARGMDPVGMALSGCSKLHAGCQLYAVNGDVVWRAAR